MLETKEKKIVNLGCGKTRIPGSLGVDSVSLDGYVDIVHDLNFTPYPFEDNSIDEVHMYHVLEHLDKPLKKIEEVYRILKVGGKFNLRVPHFSSMGAFTDLTHVRPFGLFSFDCLVPGNYQNFYTTSRFTIETRRIKYLGLSGNEGDYEKYIHGNHHNQIINYISSIIDYFINLHPLFFERIWCYWIGGATEVVITLKKI